jgi:hypothetical protein
MFEEPSNYSGGGLVAFAAGDEVEAEMSNYQKILEAVQAKFGPAELGPYSKMQREELLKETQNDPEQRKRDLYGALAKFGFGLAANKSPFFLQAVGESASAALPDISAGFKERRDTKRKAVAGLAGLEQADRGEQRENMKTADGMYTNIGRRMSDREQIASREKISAAEIAAARENSIRSANTQLAAARMQADRKTDFDEFVSMRTKGLIAAGDKRPPAVIAAEEAKAYIESRNSFGATNLREGNDIRETAVKLAQAAIGPGGSHTKNYREAVRTGQGDAYYQRLLNSFKRDLGGSGGNDGWGQVSVATTTKTR